MKPLLSASTSERSGTSIWAMAASWAFQNARMWASWVLKLPAARRALTPGQGSELAKRSEATT